MQDLVNAVRLEFRTVDLHDIMHKSPRALLGVTVEAEQALAKLDITTVFDLATSTAFAQLGRPGRGFTSTV